MNIGKYIYATLSADAAVSAIVGTRIFPVFMPMQAEYPAIVYTVTNEPLDQTKAHAGYYDRSIVTLHLWADVAQGAQAYSVLEDLDLAVRAALDYVSATAGGVTVDSCRYTGSQDGRDENNLAYLKQVTYHFTVRN